MSSESATEGYRRRTRWPALVIIGVLAIAGVITWGLVLKPEPAADSSCNPPGAAPTTSSRAAGTTADSTAAGTEVVTTETTATDATTAPSTTLGQITDRNTLKDTRPANPATVLIQVVNASTTPGMAKTVTETWRKAGFDSIRDASDDPLYPAADLRCWGEIRYGPAGLPAARTVLIVAPCATLVLDDRFDDSVEFAVGALYQDAALTAEQQAQLTEIKQASTPPAVIEGVTQAAPTLATTSASHRHLPISRSDLMTEPTEPTANAEQAPSRTAFGVDIGGTGIKGGVVNLDDGTLIGDRFRLDTPQPATPDAVASTVHKIAANFDFKGSFGCAFPGVVTHGVVHTAANVDESWVGVSLVDTVSGHVPGPVTALNDADAAGLAEVRYGAGKGHPGLIIVVTFGTGIGTALINDGVLIPNAELGHIELDGHDAESKAAASARDREGLNWEQWSKRANRYLTHLENLLWPELFIFGGGITKNPQKWVPHLKTRTPIKVAAMRNNAGIVGAALAASESQLL